MSASIPQGLTELLEEFAISVLREKPDDLVVFAAQYFNKLLESREQEQTPGRAAAQSVTPAGDHMESEQTNPSVTREVDMNNDGECRFTSCQDPFLHRSLFNSHVLCGFPHVRYTPIPSRQKCFSLFCTCISAKEPSFNAGFFHPNRVRWWRHSFRYLSQQDGRPPEIGVCRILWPRRRRVWKGVNVCLL